MQWILWQTLQLQNGIEVPHDPESGLNCVLLILGCVVTVGFSSVYLPMWGFRVNCLTHSLFSGKLEGWWPQGAPQGDFWTISSPLLKKVHSSIFFLFLADINFTSPDSLMKIKVSQKVFCFFMSGCYLHLADKSAWPWKATLQQTLVTLQSQASVEHYLSLFIPSYHFLSLLSTIMMLMVTLGIR